ncbi:protein of unknown function [Rathayibacter oskolensis]|uniref:DUF4192 domain-containing protein n=1 Tax=Rathayibacter oskolensis TaxID=1891671 RepID=A0A1X7NR38_9MICO|nr:DUF4192 family protein [Rathayibacter oskolensis]SMH40517.1 protein of unknown function [Rathayibacter oskolensis]
MTRTEHPASGPSHRVPDREPELLRASGFEDLLSAVPSMIGMRPENSLVVVPFLGRRASGGFRIPLPERLRRAEIEELARGCVRIIRSVPHAGSVLAVVYTAASYEQSGGVPMLELGRAILRRVERTDFGIVGVAWVADDGWGRYTVPTETRRPRPLSEIETSETGLFARAATPEPLDVVALASLPAVDDDDRAVVAAVLARGAVDRERNVIPTVERWLEGGVTPQWEARIIRILQSPPLRDQLTIQIALGREAAEESRRRQRRLEAVQAFTGETMDEIVERELASEDADAHDIAAAALLMGTGSGPDRDRIGPATDALARLAALAPLESRPAVLTVLAWCWWSRGVASLAAVHLDSALRIDPGYSMAQLYTSVFNYRSLPDWVIDEASRSLVSASERP